MGRPLAVVFHKRAQREIVAVGQWWRENRGSARLIAEQILWIASLLAMSPHLGAAVHGTRRAGVRRFYLERIDYHLYYAVDPSGARVVVLSLWHARRRPPRL